MDKHTARILLESLLQRIEDSPDTGKRRLAGVISDAEWTALQVALEALRATDPKHGAGEDSVNRSEGLKEDHPIQDRPSARNLLGCSRSLELASVEDPEVTLCLDFGTAMSKAFAVKGTDSEYLQLLDLGLGLLAGEAGVYPVTSSLWIEENGRIFVGRAAFDRSLKYGVPGRQRFDSMKQYLSQGLHGNLDEMPLEEAINPSNVRLTVGDAVTLYLGYLTDLAVTDLNARHGVSRYVRRHFALPCWPDERRQWGEAILRTLLARAQLVADALHSRWGDGIPADEAKALLDAVRGVDNLPLYLIGRGVLEPLAAGSSRMCADKTPRGLVMVVDVGAGTTDLALFYVRRVENDRWHAWHVGGATKAIRQAGDTIDNILRKVILEKARVSPGDRDFKFVDADLGLRIRQLKERLFQGEELNDRLANDSAIRILLGELLSRPEMKTFETQLRETFQSVLEAADPSFFERLGAGGLSVVLTGGGATIPVVGALSSGQSRVHGHNLTHRATPLIPEFLESEYPDLAREYPQLAVAMGGASPDLIKEMASLQEMPGAAQHGWVLGGYYTKGV